LYFYQIKYRAATKTRQQHWQSSGGGSKQAGFNNKGPPTPATCIYKVVVVTMVEFFSLLSATLFFVSNILLIIFYAKERQRAHFDWSEHQSLNPDYLQTEWEYRQENRPFWLASGFINAFAWFFFSFPMIQLAWILSRQGTRQLWIHVSIAILILAGSFTEWISRLCWIGATLASELLVSNFNLDDWLRGDISSSIQADGSDGLGWRTLEVNHIVSSGFIWFVDAFEWLCLSGALILTYVSVRQWRVHDTNTFGGRWNAMGLFIGLMCLLEFTAEILRFEGFRTFGPIALVYATFNRLILMPLWIVILGFALPRAVMMQKYGGENTSSELALTEMNDNLPPTITIEEDTTLAPAPITPTSPPLPTGAFAE
jgi:hypothetical protein